MKNDITKIILMSILIGFIGAIVYPTAALLLLVGFIATLLAVTFPTSWNVLIFIVKLLICPVYYIGKLFWLIFTMWLPELFKLLYYRIKYRKPPRVCTNLISKNKWWIYVYNYRIKYNIIKSFIVSEKSLY